MTSLSPFELVSQNLLSIGALSIDDFISSPHEPFARHDVFHDPHPYGGSPDLAPIPAASLPLASGSSIQTNVVAAPIKPVGGPRTMAPPTKSVKGTPSNTETSSTTLNANLARLHHTCVRQFGQTNNCLKFDFVEEAVDKKQCILTITRPDGAARSYRTEPVFRRKTDAKIQAALIATEHGAMDFIMYGDSDELKAKKGVLLAPLEDNHPVASTSKLSSDPQRSIPESEPLMVRVKEIEACCQEWRGDLVKPYWLNFDNSNIDSEALLKYGAILKIQLTPHCHRVYSCEPTFDTPSEAREQCANLAIGENVLEFIRHGNGQTAPQSDLTSSSVIPESCQSLQTFYESLPRPFEEPFGDKTAEEITAVSYLSNLLQTAKGARFTSEFYPLVKSRDTSIQSYNAVKTMSTDMHGCLLRIKRPGECRSYLVEPRFGALKNAKAAVSLLAFSMGAGKWIREAAEAVEARITPEIRRFAQTSLFPTLAQESQRLSGTTPRWEFSTDGDAFGSRLQVNLNPQGKGDGTNLQQYSVPAEYRSKPDAKIAVTYLAAQQGVIDLLRGNGQFIPGQPPAFTCYNGVPQIAPNPNPTLKKKNKKRNKDDGGDPEAPPAKRLRTVSGLPLRADIMNPGLIYDAYLQGARRGIQQNELPIPSKSRPRSPSLEEGELLEDSQSSSIPYHSAKRRRRSQRGANDARDP